MDSQEPSSETWGRQFSDLEGWFRQAAAKHSVPGVSLAVVKDAKLAWSLGVGVEDRTLSTPVTGDSVFEAASMSKPVFAYPVMKLREQGILDLDRPLTKYTKERFLAGDSRLDQITTRHVLSHTSGFQDIRSRQHPLRIHFTPGAKWQYSGEGFAYLQSVTSKLAGLAAESSCERFEMDLQVCGTDFDAYMKEHVLVPLGMTASGYLWPEGARTKVARPHDERGQPMPARTYTSRAAVARYASMGGLLTTANDYARFLIAFLDPKPADQFHLSQSSLDEMLRPQVKVEDGPGYSIAWALGWKVATTEKLGVLVSHGGDQPGFRSLAEMSPSRKSGYVILTNGEHGWKLIQEVAPELAKRIHAAPAGSA